MKKLTLIVAAILIASAVGCNDKLMPENTTTTSTATASVIPDTTAATETPETEETVTSVPASTSITTEYKSPELNYSEFDTSTEDFKKMIDSVIDPSHYSISGTGGYVLYMLNTEHSKNIKYNISSNVYFSDEKVVTLPSSYKDISKFGWTTRFTEDHVISGGVQTGIDYKNANGEEVILWTTGNAELKDCKYHKLRIDIYEFTSDINGKNVTRYYKKNATPKFSLSGGITEESSIGDVINIVGSPKTITFYESQNAITLMYKQTENGITHSTAITFSADSGKMTKIEIQ